MSATLNRVALKRVANIAGAILCVVAAVLLLRRGIALGSALGERLTHIPPAAFAAALGLYMTGSALLGVAWARLVRVSSVVRPHLLGLLAAHLRSQLAKYLPGNVFHLAYRHLAARRDGVRHRELGLALALESVLLIAAAATLALGIVTDPRIDTLLPWARYLVWAAPMFAVLAWAGIRLGGRHFGIGQTSLGSTMPILALVLAADLAFFILAGFALRSLCDQPAILSPSAWGGWLALAWAVGYVTPGAPAGLGLREAVLVLGMKPMIGEADALALALAYRLVTLSSDGVLALVGLMLFKHRAAVEPADGLETRR